MNTGGDAGPCSAMWKSHLRKDSRELRNGDSVIRDGNALATGGLDAGQKMPPRENAAPAVDDERICPQVFREVPPGNDVYENHVLRRMARELGTQELPQHGRDLDPACVLSGRNMGT